MSNDAPSLPQRIYLLNPERGLFFEIAETDNRMRIRRGDVGRPCIVYRMSWKTPGKGREQFLRLVAAWKEKGFVEAEPEAEIEEACEATELFAADIEDHPVFSRFFRLGWSAELRGTRKRIMLFPNGFSYDGDFDVEETADTQLISGLIIQGDVRVSGVFSQLTYTYPGSILITGSVHAHSLGQKDSHMVIDGDVHVENVVYGEYNDGQLEIGGDVHGKAWISEDHSMSASGTKYLPSFDSNSYTGPGYTVLSPKLLNLDGNVDWDALREFIFARKSPLRKGFVFTQPAAPATAKPPVVTRSALCEKLYGFALAGNIEDITECLVGWSDRDAEWADFVRGRLAAPTTTVEQHARLTAALREQGLPVATERMDESVEQVPTFAEAHPDVQNIVRTMSGRHDATLTRTRLEVPLPLQLIRSHSHILLVNALLKNQEFPGVYKPVIERLLALGADPRLSRVGGKPLIEDSLVQGQPDIAELMHKLCPYTPPEWQPPESGHVEDPDQAHPTVQRFFNALSENPDHALAVLDALPDPKLVTSHSWILLINTLIATQRDPTFIAVTERLLELGAAPKASTGRTMSAVQFAESECMWPTLELFYARAPDLPRVPFSGKEVLARLLEWEDANVDWDAPERQSWLESIEEVELVVESLPRLPRSLGRLPRLKSLKLACITLDDTTVPDSIGDIKTLTHLILKDLGLSALPESLFGRLTNLQKLDLAMNRLTTIPDAIADLPNLVELHLFGNPFTRLPDLSKLTRRLDRLDLSETPFHELSMIRIKEEQVAASRSSRKKTQRKKKQMTAEIKDTLRDVERRNLEAYDLQASDPKKAFALFQQTRAIAEEHAKDLPDAFAPHALSSLAGELWCTNELAERTDGPRGVWTMDNAVSLAREILARTEGTGSFYYTAEGELERNSRTLAHNTLGYYLLQSGEQLDEALTHINAALEDTDYASVEATFASVLENKVRILLALKREGDAYAVVYQMQRRFPDVQFFAGIAATPDYRRWDAEN